MELIVFAHPLEAQPALEKLKAREIEMGRLWRFDGGTIIVTGMGTAAAAAAVGKYAEGHEQILNIGFAGSLRDHPIGTVVEIGECCKHIPIPTRAPAHCERMARKAYPPLTVGTGARLISSDYPIHSQEERDKLSAYDLVDMEGYGIALAAKRAELPCTLLKVVSDSCSEGGWDAIASHLESLQERIATLVEEQLLPG